MKNILILIIAGAIVFVGSESIVAMADSKYSHASDIHTWVFIFTSWIFIFKPVVGYWWNRIDNWLSR